MASSGTILARVYTSRAQIPVQGATVAFTQKGAGTRHKLLAVRITDESGKTSPVVLETPDSATGQDPGGVTPFALCDVWVQSQGYELLLVEDVQVFPNTATVQDAMLIPLSEQAPPSARGEVFQVTTQDL